MECYWPLAAIGISRIRTSALRWIAAIKKTQISVLLTAANGQELPSRNSEKKTCPVCGQIRVLHGTMPRLFTDVFWANRLTQKGKVSYEPYKSHELACYSAIFHIIVVSLQ